MKDTLYDYISSISAINTHSHHMEDGELKEFDLSKLLNGTYIAWSGAKFDESKKSREEYLELVKFKSYFVWLQKAIKEIYDIDDDLTAENWDVYDEKIKNAYKDDSWHINLLKEKCNYQKVIMDAYWDPGFNNGDKLFTSTFRVDPLLHGYDKSAFSHDLTNAFKLYGKEFSNIDDFMTFAENLIKDKVKNGCIALKCAIAYDRDLCFLKTTKEEANKFFEMKGRGTPKAIADFQNYVIDQICKIAVSCDIPIQFHTGLGGMDNTNAMSMVDLIRRNPKTKFILFHGSFPWTDDIVGLLHFYPNVYVDICWMPILSPTSAVHALHQFMEVATSDKICWGCDTWTSEESYGARLAVNSVLTDVLFEKIQSGYLTHDGAKEMANNILANNAKKLFKL